MSGLDQPFWNSLLPALAEGEVVPIVGPGAVTFGLGNELLYPWLAQRLPLELDPPLRLDPPGRDLQEVVDAQRAAGQPIGRVYKRLHRIVRDSSLRPGPTLAALPAIEGFQRSSVRRSIHSWRGQSRAPGREGSLRIGRAPRRFAAHALTCPKNS
jgi:hypothetical protein